MKNDEKTKLINALSKARTVGLAASKATKDGGTCNFDAPTLRLPNIRKTTIEEICEAAGVTCSKWEFMNEWVIRGCSMGQAGANTAGAEAAKKVLEEAGFEAGMYYQMD